MLDSLWKDLNVTWLRSTDKSNGIKYTLADFFLFCRRETSFRPTCNTRICSAHFPSGKEAGPTLFPWNSDMLFEMPSPEKKTRKRMSTPITTSSTIEDADDTDTIQPALESPAPAQVSPSPECQQYFNDIHQLKEDNQILHQQLKYCQGRMTFDQISDDKNKVSFFTGLPDKEIFTIISYLLFCFPLQYHSDWKVDTLAIREQLLLTLMRLRLNLKIAHLSFHFNVSTSTVSNVFVTIVSALFDILYSGINPASC